MHFPGLYDYMLFIGRKYRNIEGKRKDDEAAERPNANSGQTQPAYCEVSQELV